MINDDNVIMHRKGALESTKATCQQSDSQARLSMNVMH